MSNIKKHKPSGPAVFMYWVIVVTALIAVISFFVYYGNYFDNLILLWTGIVAFTVMYHLWMRIIMGNISKLFKVDYKQWWYKEKFFEKKLYNLLKVKNWKNKALTYNPELYSLKENTLEGIANTTVKSELDHWINVGISLSTVLFSIIWGIFWIFLATAILAILFDMQFVIIQRYNRPRLIKLINKSKKLHK